jgi:tetratricopeptide (TPR) repeat protein
MSEEQTTPEGAKKKINCFVVIGFGTKTDYANGRVLNLDRTYTKLIKPALDRVGVHCFRAIDVNRAGGIDEIMYHWLYEADMVVADLSTLNANVFYELGVRHAQKPNTTLVIAESEMMSRIPFDLSHTVIHAYEHLGEDISDEETERFVDHLASTVQAILDNPIDRDSPVYTHLRGMTPPEYTDVEKRIAELEKEREADADDIRKQSLAMIVETAEAAKNRGDYDSAIGLFQAAIAQNESDIFLRQRLALVTYKRKERDGDDAAAITALEEAERALAFCEPETSTDPETLGLAGAIHKRLWERTGEDKHLEKSIGFYERGFYVKQDYYNGINVAFLYTLKALQTDDDFDAIVYYGHGNLIRERVADVCLKMMESESFEGRGDKEWVVQTLAQAYLGMGKDARAEALMPKLAELSKGAFDMDTFKRQNQQLVDGMQAFAARVRIPSADSEVLPPVAAPVEKVVEVVSEEAVPTSPVVTRRAGQPIVIDLGENNGRKLRKLRIDCRIEFDD